MLRDNQGTSQGGSQGGALVKPERRTELVEITDSLSQEATMLSELIGKLIARLEVVSRKEPCSEQDNKCEPPYASQAASKLDSVRHTIKSAREAVARQLQLLEV